MKKIMINTKNYEDDEDQEGSSKGGLLITVAAAAVKVQQSLAVLCGIYHQILSLTSKPLHSSKKSYATTIHNPTTISQRPREVDCG